MRLQNVLVDIAALSSHSFENGIEFQNIYVYYIYICSTYMCIKLISSQKVLLIWWSALLYGDSPYDGNIFSKTSWINGVCNTVQGIEQQTNKHKTGHNQLSYQPEWKMIKANCFNMQTAKCYKTLILSHERLCESESEREAKLLFSFSMLPSQNVENLHSVCVCVCVRFGSE